MDRRRSSLPARQFMHTMATAEEDAVAAAALKTMKEIAQTEDETDNAVVNDF